MIRPSNIDIDNHTADFKCDVHDSSITGLNVNSSLVYDDAGNIKITGSQLTSGADTCNHETMFPNEPNHIREYVSKLSQAKTS